MQLEKNMYVRTQKYGIAKIIGGINDNKFNIDIFKKDGITLRCQKAKDILKASHNIIDLIEVGDYVNGMKVNNIAIEDGLIFLHMDADECLHENTMLTGDDIKSIVTKEQFESIKYSLEG